VNNENRYGLLPVGRIKSPQPNINQKAKTMSKNIIQLNQEIIYNELRDLVRNSVEKTLNAILNQEADVLIESV
jgi:hypothetical protein